MRRRPAAALRLAVVLEQRFYQTPDGAGWTPHAFARPFWERYREAFASVAIVARAEAVDVPPPDARRADGDGVALCPVPLYVGPAAFVRRSVAVRRAIAAAMAEADAAVLRTPGTLAMLAHAVVRQRGLPYQTEVVGDPLDVFAPGAMPHPGRAVFRTLFAASQRALCTGATVAAYVTAHALQARYPPGPKTFATHYSDVELPPDAFVGAPPPPSETGPFTLVTVASMEQPYKAVDVQLDAVARLRRDGRDVRLRVVGDGRLRPSLEGQAKGAGLAGAVAFVGSLPGAAAVREELDRADVFLLPSRTEGLPRAMVEAMARGLPCLGTSVGGLPELLEATERVPVDDAVALAQAVAALLDDPARRARLGRTNWERARAYEETRLAPRRAVAYHRLAAAARRAHV